MRTMSLSLHYPCRVPSYTFIHYSLSRSSFEHATAFLNQLVQLLFHVLRKIGINTHLHKNRFHAYNSGNHFFCGISRNTANLCKYEEVFFSKILLFPIHIKKAGKILVSCRLLLLTLNINFIILCDSLNVRYGHIQKLSYLLCIMCLL